MVQYQGSSNGFHGKVTATVTLEDGIVKDVVSEHSPTAYVGSLGIERVIENMKQAQTVEVDAVSGATFSTTAFLTAAKKAVAVAENKLTPAEALDVTVSLNQDDVHVDAVSSASIAAGAEPENTSVARQPVVYHEDLTFDQTYDVVIAGSGGAGLAAAVEAARSGLSTIVFEKSGIPGGTTNYSGGVVQAAGTRYQKEYTAFQEDSPEKHAQLWTKAGENQVDEQLVRDLAEHAPENIEWVADMGLKWKSLYSHSHIPYVKDELHADRIHQYENGGGSGSGTILTQTLLKAALEAGAQIVYNAPVVALVHDPVSKEVFGAVVEENGEEKLIRALQGVVLATASVDNNPALAKALHPQQFHDLNYSTVLTSPSDTGDGIIMGMASGGAISGMGGCIDFDGKTGNATNNQVPTIPLFFVNGSGNRFVCEDATYAYQYRAIFQQQKQLGKPTYMIFGANSITEPGSSWTAASLAQDVAAGIVQKADTIEALAELIHVEPANLKRTLDTWNLNASRGEDPEYSRIQGIKPLQAPYYAYINRATNLGSIGGLKINVDCQVLDPFGETIEGLYAAGMNAGGWIGGYYPGSGTAIAGIMHHGRKAGQHLAKKAQANEKPKPSWEQWKAISSLGSVK